MNPLLPQPTNNLIASSISNAWHTIEAENLLNWFAMHRRDLPWRRLQEDPYAVWISEIMLQQTQVATVIGYFNRWILRFPTVMVLAEAPIEEVLRHWEGLGYYARARNIHKAAIRIVEDFGGTLPLSPSDLSSLPGIGPYTHGAILSLAFNLRVPIVDTNVERVLTRRFGIGGDPKSPIIRSQIWRIAEEIMPDHSAREFNSALMELGALVCRPVDPNCSKCPLEEKCFAAKSDNPLQWPQLAAPKRTVKVRQSCVAICDNGRWLMIRRPLEGLWGGLWEFPRREVLPGETLAETAIRASKEVVGMDVEIISEPVIVRHAVMHYNIELSGYVGTIIFGVPTALACMEFRWVTSEEVNELPLSSPQRKLAGRFMRHTAPKHRHSINKNSKTIRENP